MSSIIRKPERIIVGHQETDRALREHKQSIDALVDAVPSTSVVEVNLPNATAVTVRHGLGRRFRFLSISPPVGAVAAGVIARTAGDDTLHAVLTATGYGATITVLVKFE